MKIQFLFPEGLKTLPKDTLQDFKNFFTPKFYKENWHKHFWISTSISLLWILLLLLLTGLGDTPILFRLFLGYGSLVVANGIREAYFNNKYQSFFDWRDIRMGGYGGILGAIIAIIVYNIL